MKYILIIVLCLHETAMAILLFQWNFYVAFFYAVLAVVYNFYIFMGIGSDWD